LRSCGPGSWTTTSGERLYISEHTVKKEAMSIHRKLGVSSRSQAVQRAQQLDLLGW
jgi:LuxR family maltose regulon positive regulatory protein